MIKFSIIIPVYNVEKYLNKCLDSIVKQTYKNYETIIVCDKCSDNSESIVDEYVKKYNNFTKIYEEHTGLSKARNIGVEASSGEYILFLDGDDYFKPNLLDVLSYYLDDTPDLIRFQIQDVKGKEIIKHNEEGFNTTDGVSAFNKIFKYHYIENAWSYCYNANFYKKNKFKFMEGCIAEDYGLIPLIIAKAKKVKSLSYIGYNYIQRENSLMSDTDYYKKVKKIEDMLMQSVFLKGKLKDIKGKELIISFINNSLIYYSTRLNYKDFKKYNKILKENKCFNHLKGGNLKAKIRNVLIKSNAYFFYHYVAR